MLKKFDEVIIEMNSYVELIVNTSARTTRLNPAKREIAGGGGENVTRHPFVEFMHAMRRGDYVTIAKGGWSGSPFSLLSISPLNEKSELRLRLSMGT